MKKTDPRDTVYTSDAEDLRRRYLLERIRTGEEEKSSPVYSSGHGINIDENNTVNIVTADGIIPDETLPPSSADVYDAFVRTDESLNQLGVNLATVRTDFEYFTEEMSDEISKINSKVSFFGVQKVLWNEGPYYMRSDHTAELSELVSEQNNGIILVWSAYESGVKDYNFFYQFVPKSHVESHNGKGVNTGIIATETFGTIGSKYVYVYDDRIAGNDYNDDSGTRNGITFNNAYWVLRYVLGV